MFKDDLDTIEKLRTEAVTVLEPHPGGIRRIQMYAAQLEWLGTKFPIDIGADFTWYSTLGYSTNTAYSQNNLKFELANILFNQAVLYCQIAATSNRSTVEGLKTAANYFCLSAGVMAHLKTQVIPDMHSTAPDDLDISTLECLEQLLLAQAQECFWQKAVKDGMKDAIIAKLAAKVSDLYQVAADWGAKSETITSEWIHHMSAKHHHFAAAAQYRAACDCLEKRKYGEEVARLKDSVTCANEGLKESRYISKAVSGDLNGLKSKAQDDLKRAEKDNDMIYLNPVPTKPELKTLERASMVKPNITKGLSDPISFLGDDGMLGKPLFAKLVPYSVHVAGSIYENRRDSTIHNIIDDLEKLNCQIYDTLKSMNLPGSLQALEKPLGLPPGLNSHAQEIRQQNGPKRLSKTLDDINRLRADDQQLLREGIQFLQSEASEDEAARRRYGTDRWTRPLSREAASSLYHQVTEVEGYFKAAQSSDETVQEKLRANEALIALLNGTDRDLEDFVPSSRRMKMSPAIERDSGRVRDCLNRISRLQTRRKQKIEGLQGKAQADDVSSDLIKEASRIERQNPMQKVDATQFEDFFDRRLERYKADKGMPSEERQEQQSLLLQLQEPNNTLREARRGDNSTRDRELALQRLENAYFAYKEIIQNFDVGRKFYNDLAPIVMKFREDCRVFAYGRREEAAHLESEIVNALPVSNLTMQSQQQQQQQQQQQHIAPPNQPRTYTNNQMHAYIDRPPPSESPLTAPRPVKPQASIATRDSQVRDENASASELGVWSPERAIKFAGKSQGQEGRESVSTSIDGRWDPTKGMKFG